MADIQKTIAVWPAGILFRYDCLMDRERLQKESIAKEELNGKNNQIVKFRSFSFTHYRRLLNLIQ
jgi:hypothetical protein